MGVGVSKKGLGFKGKRPKQVVQKIFCLFGLRKGEYVFCFCCWLCLPRPRRLCLDW